MKDVVELRPALQQVVEQLLSRCAQVLADAVDELGVADLVLHLRGERELALERRRAQDPVALGQDAHQLGVAVHRDELHEQRAVLVGHRVARLDDPSRLDVLEERASVVTTTS